MNTPLVSFYHPPEKPIRIACAGLGFIFKNAHAKALGFLQSRGWPVEVAMVCDRDQAALDEACRSFPSAKPTQNLEDILGCAHEVDALLICLWPPLGLQVLRQAIERGFKKILIEKPVSHHASDIKSVAEEARRAGVQVQVAYNRRHQPALPAFAEALSKLKPLDVVNATLLRVNRNEPLFFLDVTPHPLSALCQLLGKLTVQQATFGELKNGIPEFLEATLQNAAGVQVKLKVQPATGRELELYEARADDQHLQLPLLPSNTPDGAGWSSQQAGVSLFHAIPVPAGLDESLLPTWRTGFISQMAQFLREEPSPFACSLDQAADILEVLESILKHGECSSAQ